MPKMRTSQYKKIDCKICKKKFVPNQYWRHKTGCCSKKCRIINQREIKSRYKKTEKGIQSEIRWRNNPIRAEQYRKYLKRSLYAQKTARRRAKLYVKIRKTKWWKNESLKGCKICGTKENIGVDHIKPIRKGGTDDIKNLQILCSKHNAIKWIK